MHTFFALASRYLSPLRADPWILCRAPGEYFPPGLLILPVLAWRRRWQEALEAGLCVASDALLLSADDAPQAYAELFFGVPMLAIEATPDGLLHACRQASQLRALGWHGELRAMGAVHIGQIAALQRAGFDTLSPSTLPTALAEPALAHA